jgi:Matrixin
MTCYTGFGNLGDHRPFFTGDFNGDGKSEILFYTPADANWWLGTFNGNTLTWAFVGNTKGFGNLADGRPIWAADFAGAGKVDILFYFPGDQNWWLGQFDANNNLSWSLAGNTAGFGQVWDGRPFWIGDFNGDGKADVLFHFPGDHNWWLGTFSGNTLNWQFAGNTSGFGNVADGRPIWAADFTGSGSWEVLFYYPGDKNWWLGSFVNGALTWNLAGNTGGFGQVWDGRPFWIGDFNGDGKADVLFHFPGDHNWWLGAFNGTTLSWSLAGNTAGFGNVADGRPIWTADFAGDGRTDILFYFPGDRNWWLGQFGPNGQISWSLAGNTTGFGQVWDGRPFWIKDFNGGGKADVLFYFPGDGNWWIGSFAGTSLNWNFAGNTGRPGSQSITIHFKSLLQLTQARLNYLADQYAAMEELFAGGGNIATFRATTEDLSGNTTLSGLSDLNVGACTLGSTTTDQNTLFNQRNNAGANDIVVYLCNTLIGGAGNFVGCAAHPTSQPGCVIVEVDTARWLTAHEVGHVLGLFHVSNTDRLMNPSIGWTNLPPDLIQSEYQTMLDSSLSFPC